MKVYHGTNARFDRIDLNKGNPDNDFGRGFYVTAVKQPALALIQTDNTFIFRTEDIITNTSLALVRDFEIDILEAMKTIYNSETFTQLTDEGTSLFEKS